MQKGGGNCITMNFIIVKYESMPVVKYCHYFESDKKESWGIDARDSFFEITVIEKGSIIRHNLDTGETDVFKEGTAFVTLHNHNYTGETGPGPNRHYTVFFSPAQVFQFISEDDVMEYLESTPPDDDCIYAILPEIYFSEITRLIFIRIEQLIENFNSTDLFKTQMSCALLFDIFSISTTYSIEYARKLVTTPREYSYTYYCNQAIRYIANHITENISVADIANSMKVSYGHLSRVFKSKTGMTLVDYINRQKVRKMEEMLNTKVCSVSEVAAKVSINDEKYAARLFKRYTGLNMSSYMKMTKQKFK